MVLVIALPWSEAESSNILRCSGYSASFRGKVIAMKGFRPRCKAADSGTGPPLFWPQSYESEKE